jgi:hypothetical protein
MLIQLVIKGLFRSALGCSGSGSFCCSGSDHRATFARLLGESHQVWERYSRNQTEPEPVRSARVLSDAGRLGAGAPQSSPKETQNWNESSRDCPRTEWAEELGFCSSMQGSGVEWVLWLQHARGMAWWTRCGRLDNVQMGYGCCRGP